MNESHIINSIYSAGACEAVAHGFFRWSLDVLSKECGGYRTKSFVGVLPKGYCMI